MLRSREQGLDHGFGQRKQLLMLLVDLSMSDRDIGSPLEIRHGSGLNCDANTQDITYPPQAALLHANRATNSMRHLHQPGVVFSLQLVRA